MAPLKAALVADSDAFGGAEAYTRRLLRFLPPSVSRSLVVAEEVAEHFHDLDQADLPMRIVPLARHGPGAPQLESALLELKPDVVQVNLVDPGSNLAALRAALAVAPTVPTLHLESERPVPVLREGPYREVAAAVAPSQPIADQLVALGVHADGVVRIRHGVEIPPQPARHRERSPLVVGAAGRLTAQKGFDLLLSAVATLRRRGRDVVVLIAGEGREHAALAERARGLPVRFLGHVQDVPALLRQLDVFCLPSRREALPFAVLEAMAHGLACVTTAVGDAVEALAGAAVIVPPGDPRALAEALDRVLTDRALRHQLAGAARARAESDLTVRRMADETAEVLQHASASNS